MAGTSLRSVSPSAFVNLLSQKQSLPTLLARLAALLLILPGVLSDLLAILLLMLPINVGPPLAPQTIGAGFGIRRRDALDGDYRRVD